MIINCLVCSCGYYIKFLVGFRNREFLSKKAIFSCKFYVNLRKFTFEICKFTKIYKQILLKNIVKIYNMEKPNLLRDAKKNIKRIKIVGVVPRSQKKIKRNIADALPANSKFLETMDDENSFIVEFPIYSRPGTIYKKLKVLASDIVDRIEVVGR